MRTINEAQKDLDVCFNFPFMDISPRIDRAWRRPNGKDGDHEAVLQPCNPCQANTLGEIAEFRKLEFRSRLPATAFGFERMTHACLLTDGHGDRQGRVRLRSFEVGV